MCFTLLKYSNLGHLFHRKLSKLWCENISPRHQTCEQKLKVLIFFVTNYLRRHYLGTQIGDISPKCWYLFCHHLRRDFDTKVGDVSPKYSQHFPHELRRHFDTKIAHCFTFCARTTLGAKIDLKSFTKNW